MIKRILVIILLMAAWLNAAATWYIATDGNDDTGDGSIGMPYATIGKGITEASAGDTIEIAVGTYTLAADLTVAKSLDFEASGAVVIDGNDTYATIIEVASGGTGPVTVTWTGTASNTITFSACTDALNGGVVCDTNANYLLTVTFTYCYFVGAVSDSNGLTMATSPAGDMTVVCTNCKAYNNDIDGFSIKGTNENSKSVRLTLTSCDSYWNDNVDNGATGGGGGAGDGVTMHSPGQILVVEGGTYYQNGKSGAALISNGSTVGGTATIKNALFYGNGVIVHTNGDLLAGSKFSSLTVERCRFKGYTTANFNDGYGHITLGEITTAKINNCLFYAPALLDAGRSIIYQSNVDLHNVYITNCIFDGFVNSTTAIYCIDLAYGPDSVAVQNCSFINCRHGIRPGTPNQVISRNLFITMTGTAIYDDYTGDKYGSVAGNIFNYYENVTTRTNSTTTQATDNAALVINRGGSSWW